MINSEIDNIPLTNYKNNKNNKIINNFHNILFYVMFFNTIAAVVIPCILFTEVQIIYNEFTSNNVSAKIDTINHIIDNVCISFPEICKDINFPV